MIGENAAFKKEVEAFQAEKAQQLAKALAAGAKEIGGRKVIAFDRSMDPAMVRNVALLLQKELSGFVLAGAYLFDGKPNLVLMYTADLVAAGKNAGKDIREAAKFIQGGGGGQPGLATAGGKNPDGLKDALEKLIEIATA